MVAQSRPICLWSGNAGSSLSTYSRNQHSPTLSQCSVCTGKSGFSRAAKIAAQAVAAQMSFGAKRQSAEIHLQPPINRASQCADFQVRDHQLLLRHCVIARRFKPRCVKPGELRFDVVAVVISRRGPLVVGGGFRRVARLSGKIRMPSGVVGWRKIVRTSSSDKPSAIAEGPIRSRETRQAGLARQTRNAASFHTSSSSANASR